MLNKNFLIFFLLLKQIPFFKNGIKQQKKAANILNILNEAYVELDND